LARSSDPIAKTVAAGLKPERKEFFAIHQHAHLDVFVNGDPVEVPAGIGIDITDPGVKRFEDPGGPGYGGIELCDNPCISPLHTHDTTGVLHTEAPENETNTLGEFFVEWGVHWMIAASAASASPRLRSPSSSTENVTSTIPRGSRSRT
jgi:hypothetical protein